MGATAVLDIGKTNVKVVVFAANGTLMVEQSKPNATRSDPPYLHIDTEFIWKTALDTLSKLSHIHVINNIVVTAHGATAAVIDTRRLSEGGLALPVLDYEGHELDQINPEYDLIRPPFPRTLSPSMTAGLNVGRQLAYQLSQFPQEFAKADAILMYPQYWSWRLSGVLATEVTSLACHTDLWEPEAGQYSTLPTTLGIEKLFPPIFAAHDVLGPILPEIAAATGLDPATRVFCGIHDSNASLVPHLLERSRPFTVVSSGTWVVVMGVGASVSRLDPKADMLANVDATGRPVACAKFMGGREYGQIAGSRAPQATIEDVAAVIESGTLALPSFAAEGGAFSGRAGSIEGNLPDRSGSRAALASLYVALMVDDVLVRLGCAEGPLLIEGSFAMNSAFCSILADLRPEQSVEPAESTVGTAYGAALLANWPKLPGRSGVAPTAPPGIDGLSAYRKRWRAALGLPA